MKQNPTRGTARQTAPKLCNRPVPVPGLLPPSKVTPLATEMATRPRLLTAGSLRRGVAALFHRKGTPPLRLWVATGRPGAIPLGAAALEGIPNGGHLICRSGGEAPKDQADFFEVAFVLSLPPDTSPGNCAS